MHARFQTEPPQTTLECHQQRIVFVAEEHIGSAHLRGRGKQACQQGIFAACGKALR